MEARSQGKLLDVCNTMGSRVEVSHKVLTFDCHALPHEFLYVQVDSLWEAFESLNSRQRRASPATRNLFKDVVATHKIESARSEG